MKAIGKVTSYDKIIAYMKDPEGNSELLTDNERKMLNRRLEAWTLIRNYNSHADAAAILMKMYPGISRATAYRDCADAISLFGDISRAKKEGIRHLSSEIAMDAINIARIKNNEDTMLRGAKTLSEINGVNTIDPELPDFASLEPHVYELALPESFVKAFQKLISGGKVDFTSFVNSVDFIEDAEIISEEEDGEY